MESLRLMGTHQNVARPHQNASCCTGRLLSARQCSAPCTTQALGVETLHQGGYYTRRIGFYKFYLKNDRIRDFLQACHTPEIAPVLDAVNQIQSTPFRINQRLWLVVDQMLIRVDTLTNKIARKKVEKASYDTYLETRFSPKAFNPKDGEKERVGVTGLRPSPLPHHRTCGFPHPAVGTNGFHRSGFYSLSTHLTLEPLMLGLPSMALASTHIHQAFPITTSQEAAAVAAPFCFR
jgi:hypothetical protein